MPPPRRDAFCFGAPTVTCLVDTLPLFLSLFFSRVLITASCSRTKRPSSLQTQDNLRVPTTLSFRPHCLLPFYSTFSFPALISLSRISLSRTNAYQHNAATMRQLYAPFSFDFSFTFKHLLIHHHWHPRGRPYYTN